MYNENFEDRGNVGVILYNTTAMPFVVTKGDRIAQLVVTRVSRAQFVQVESLDETERGTNGWGSTGR